MKLNVVILYSAGHLGSAMLINKLLQMPEMNIVGVVKAQPLKLSLKGWTRIKRHLIKVSWCFAWLLFWQRCVQGLGYLITLTFPFLRKRLKPAWKIAADHNIPTFQSQNINDPASQAFIKQHNPDLLISAYFSQILKKDVISFTIEKEKDMYYPMPGEKDFESYFEQRRFFRIRDVLGLLVMKKHR